MADSEALLIKMELRPPNGKGSILQKGVDLFRNGSYKQEKARLRESG
jgi:hypothetical protein